MDEAEAATPDDVFIGRNSSADPDSSKPNDPKLYVDVNIGRQKIVRIVVFEGDTAQSLARDFCEKHSLDNEMKLKMVELLDQQMKGVLSKMALAEGSVETGQAEEDPEKVENAKNEENGQNKGSCSFQNQSSDDQAYDALPVVQEESTVIHEENSICNPSAAKGVAPDPS